MTLYLIIQLSLGICQMQKKYGVEIQVLFSSLIAKAEQGGFIRGFKIKGRGEDETQVSHLLFADDTLLFCEDDVEQLRFWKWIVICFELVSGLKINLPKSEIIPIEEMVDVNRAAFLFGCKVGKLLISYLGP